MNESKISSKKWKEGALSVNMIPLSKKFHLAERNRMLTGSDAEPSNTYFILHKGELSILKDKREESTSKERIDSFSFSDH